MLTNKVKKKCKRHLITNFSIKKWKKNKVKRTNIGKETERTHRTTFRIDIKGKKMIQEIVYAVRRQEI